MKFPSFPWKYKPKPWIWQITGDQQPAYWPSFGCLLLLYMKAWRGTQLPHFRSLRKRKTYTKERRELTIVSTMNVNTKWSTKIGTVVLIFLLCFLFENPKTLPMNRWPSTLVTVRRKKNWVKRQKHICLELRETLTFSFALHENNISKIQLNNYTL